MERKLRLRTTSMDTTTDTITNTIMDTIMITIMDTITDTIMDIITETIMDSTMDTTTDIIMTTTLIWVTNTCMDTTELFTKEFLILPLHRTGEQTNKTDFHIDLFDKQVIQGSFVVSGIRYPAQFLSQGRCHLVLSVFKKRYLVA